MKNKIRSIIYKILGLNLISLKSEVTNINRATLINKHITKGALSSSSREIISNNPLSWEFSAFSQNNEDGIIDYLTKKILAPNRYFVEVGAGTGIECNTAYLAFVQNFSGLMIDGNKKQIEVAQSLQHNLGVEYYSTFFNLDNVSQIKDWSIHLNPDVFSWDTDGNDYYFVKKLFEIGFRPRIFVVEYNSSFGPDKIATIVYNETFNIQKAHPSQLYYGCSISMWNGLFAKHGYSFVTVDSNGVNAIYIDKSEFDESFVNNISGISFAENFYQKRKFKSKWQQQYEHIKEMPFYEE